MYPHIPGEKIEGKEEIVMLMGRHVCIASIKLVSNFFRLPYLLNFSHKKKLVR